MTVSALKVTGASVRTDVCVPVGAELSSSVCPSATPIPSHVAGFAVWDEERRGAEGK